MAVFTRRQFSAEKGICHMPENTITQLPDPSGFSADAFTDVLRNGARKLIEQAIHAELATLMAAFSKEKLEALQKQYIEEATKLWNQSVNAQPELKDKILANMSSRAAATLKEDLESRGPMRLSEVEAQQKEILKIVRRLADEGQIVIGGGGGDDAMV